MSFTLVGSAAVVLIVLAGVALLLSGCVGRISDQQRQAVSEAEARVTDAAASLGGEVRDISRLELGTGAASLSTDPHLEVRFDVHGPDLPDLYEQLAAQLDLSPAVNGATSLGLLLGGVRVQLVPGEDHLSVFITGTS